MFHRPSSGFTLMELLIAMTIVSLLATTALFGWRVAVSAWQKANTRLQGYRNVLAVNQLLNEQIASMVPYQAQLAQNKFIPFFQGEPQTARFLSRYSLTGRSSSGLYRIEYQIAEEDGGTKQLLLNEFPVRSREELSALIAGSDSTSVTGAFKFLPFERGLQTVVLAEGLAECGFEYYKPPSDSKPGAWVDLWASERGELPQGMAIRMVTHAETGDLKPVSIVAAIRSFSRNEGLLAR